MNLILFLRYMCYNFHPGIITIIIRYTCYNCHPGITIILQYDNILLSQIFQLLIIKSPLKFTSKFFLASC